MSAQSGLRRLLAGIALLALPLGATLADPLPKGIIALDGSAAPPLALKNLDDVAFDLVQAKGRWLFVHFWASWCGPCRREMPTIQAIHAKFDPAELQIVLVNTAESEDTVFTFLGAVAPDLNSLLDQDGLVTERWQPRGLPATFLVDPQGKLRYVVLGGRPWNRPAYVNFLRQLVKK